MTPPSNSTRHQALITGASSGIGAAFAERLARDGHDLVLVARRRDRLEGLAERLRRDFGVNAKVLVADLTDSANLAEVEARIRNESLSLLVNNAGFGGYNPFVSIEPKVIDDLIAIHIRAVARLTRAALPGMVERASGSIINIASLLALSGTLPPNPMPYRCVYAGAKAFMLAFTQTLAGELNGTGVKVQVCLPAVVETEFKSAAAALFKKMSPDDVVTACLSGLTLGEVVCVPPLPDAALFATLSEVQRAVLKAAVAEGSTLAERYR